MLEPCGIGKYHQGEEHKRRQKHKPMRTAHEQGHKCQHDEHKTAQREHGRQEVDQFECARMTFGQVDAGDT